MQMAVNVTNLYHLPCLTEIEKVIDENLTHNWILRIQHANEIKPYATDWNQWGETKFALKNSASVIHDIILCHARHTDHSIRLCAEKTQPRIQFIYPVFKPVDKKILEELIR